MYALGIVFGAMSNLIIFCRQVRSRSAEHASAVRLLFHANHLGQVVSILRQELDSMIRTIYLLSICDRIERQRLIDSSVNGGPWTVNGRKARITDKDMADRAGNFQGWTASAYKFGCSFIHLSAFHDYSDRDPFRSLPNSERQQILQHMRNYHGGPVGNDPSFADIAKYFPAVFDKVSGNLACYLKSLENDEDIQP